MKIKCRYMQWTIVIILLALLGVLAGCTNGEQFKGGIGGNEEEATEQVDHGELSEQELEQEDKVFDFKGGTIRIGQWWGMESYLSEEELTMQRNVEEKFNVKIEYVTVPFDEIQSKIITTSVAGRPFADIVMIPTEWVFPKMVNEGYLRPIDDLVDLSRPEWNNLMLQYGKANGKQYSFTDKDNNGHGFYYNKRIIQENNLEDPYVLQERGLWTWDKFLELAKAVTKDNVYGVDYYDEDLDLVLPFIYSNNGAVTRNDVITFDEPEALEAIQFVSDLYHVHKVVGRKNGTWENGEILFRPGYRWSAYDWNESMIDDWGYVFFPMGPRTNRYTVPIVVNMWHLMAASDNPEGIMAVWQELYEIDQEKSKEATIKAEEANFRTEEGLATLRKMIGNGTIMEFYAYEGFEGYFRDAIENIMSGKGKPADELARIKPLTQASIDVTLKN